jgi:uncharacterized protein (DUF924 family)
MVNCKNTPKAIIEFWIGDSGLNPDKALARKKIWYWGGDKIDTEIKLRFGALVLRACNQRLSEWEKNPGDALALIILLDQFTRNLFRNTLKAYIGDVQALRVLKQSIDVGLDLELDAVSRIWLYHPFHHSELIEEQDRGIGLLQNLRKECEPKWSAYIDSCMKGWTGHRDIVAKFGRFPHRNYLLGRTCTKEEMLFLSSSGKSFGQGPKRVKDC